MTEDVLAQGDETRGHVPLVSVIIPVYDQGRFLSCTVKSVLAQDLGDLELVLVDDGSCDGSQATCLRRVRMARILRRLPSMPCSLSTSRNSFCP